jgi:hypothetical protein
LRESRSFLDPRLRRSPQALPRQFGDCDQGALAAGDFDCAITVEAGDQDAASPSPPCSGPRLRGFAGCNVDMACL